MAYAVLNLIFIVFCTLTVPLAAQSDCRFNSVDNLTLSLDVKLSWDPYPWGSCTIDHYLVYIKLEYEDEKVFITNETSFDVSFLPLCASARFIVTPVSPTAIQGASFWIDESLPVPPNMNLTIESLYLNLAFGGIMLSWWLEDQFSLCAKRYQVLIYDEDSDNPVDVYVTENFYVIYDYELVPCTTYRFGVRALYNLEQEGPVSHLIRYTARTQRITAPKLANVNVGMTYVELTWQMQSIAENRCAVSTLTIDASPHFIISYPVRDQNSRQSFTTLISWLIADTMYLFNMTATTAGGKTDPVLLGIQTQPIILT